MLNNGFNLHGITSADDFWIKESDVNGCQLWNRNNNAIHLLILISFVFSQFILTK